MRGPFRFREEVRDVLPPEECPWEAALGGRPSETFPPERGVPRGLLLEALLPRNADAEDDIISRGVYSPKKSRLMRS